MNLIHPSFADKLAERQEARKKRKLDLGIFGTQPFEVTGQPHTVVHYRIKITGPIEDAEQFADAVEVLERAGPEDMVDIHLSSPGGCLDATDTFLHALRNCEAQHHIIATGGCHSAATVILLNSPSIELSSDFNALVHNGSTGNYSKTSDFRSASAFSIKYMDRMMHKTYEGFMTPEEIDRLCRGEDFWFDAKEFWERRERRMAMWKARYEAQQAQGQTFAIENLSDHLAEDDEEEAPAPPPPKRRKKTT